MIRRILILLLLVLPLLGQETTRRLILKDGSYQLVTKYEVKGDRVRYYSSEREEWEELPNKLVDWPATEKFESDRASAPEAVQLDKELERESEAAEAALPQVAPGLRIPEEQGVFLLDAFQGQAQLSEIQQNASDINRQTKGNILRGAINPVAGVKQTIELEGSHAAVQAHVQFPSIYINVETGPEQGPEAQSSTQSQAPAVAERYHILKVEVKGNKRILGDVKRQLTGKVTQQQHLIKTTANQLAGGWTKLTPAERLAPGEYAVVEMLGKEGMNLYVWDFGVNPNAPANANPWKPEFKPASKPESK
jgi:hypothetical protein